MNEWNVLFGHSNCLKSVNNSFELKWMCFRWMDINPIHCCSTYVQASVSIMFTVLFSSVHPPNSLNLALLTTPPPPPTHFTLYFSSFFSHSNSFNKCNERRKNRRITEIIRFNYIYIHFCLSWIISSIRDFAAGDIVALFFLLLFLLLNGINITQTHIKSQISLVHNHICSRQD